MNKERQQMEDLVGRYVEAFNQQDLDAVNALLAQDFVGQAPSLLGLPSNREGEKAFAQQLMSAFPDLWGNIEQLITDGDAVAARITWRGTQRGPLLDTTAPGEPLSVTAVHVMKAANGMIVEHWVGFDPRDIRRQLAATDHAASVADTRRPALA